MVEPIPPSSVTLKGWMETSIPDPISWWPQTIGWKVVACIAFILLIRFLVWRYRVYRFNRYRREALWALKQGSSGDLNARSHYYFQILKVVAQHIEPSTAPMSEMDFMAFLDKTSSKMKTSFNGELGKRWSKMQVDPSIALDFKQAEQLKFLCIDWIKTHRYASQLKTKKVKTGWRIL